MAIKIKSKKENIKLINIDHEKCVNCHACIAVCPVKYCNDGTKETLDINESLCIGCGKCISRCTHDARQYIDDFNIFEDKLLRGEKLLVLVAPSVVSNFGDKYLKLNGWLKSLNIPVFDVSFGAELTVKSYSEYIKNNQSKVIISSACPSVVNYIELYTPELIQYLAPIDTPIGHTVKMIRNNFTQYDDYTIVVFTPCLAKKIEFSETFEEKILNIGFKTINEYIDKNSINLDDYEDVEYEAVTAERGVVFPNPRGLLTTLERILPDVSNITRQVEGTENVYDYFENLNDVIKSGKSKRLIDCLNCDKGCNVGCLSINDDRTIEDLEYDINKRKNKNISKTIEIEKEVDKYWDKDLFIRTYKDKSHNNTLISPTKKELKDIYASMYKFSQKDLKDCNSCGYGLCQYFATSVYNGLNKPENCHHYLEHQKNKMLEEMINANNKIYSLFKTLPIAACIIKEDGLVEVANSKLYQLLNVKDGVLINQSIFKKYLSKIDESFDINMKDFVVSVIIKQFDNKYVLFMEKK